MKATIRLFRALPIKELQKKEVSHKLLEETIPRGFVFSPEVVYNYPEQELFDMVKLIEEEVGLTPEQMNNTFQKSWKKVQDASMNQLIIEQLIHYFTTYGFQNLGIYDKDSVYVPHGDLEIPELGSDINIVVIKGYTKEELKNKLMNILNSGVALAEETMKDALDVAVFTDISEDEVNSVKNKEILTVLYDFFDFFPENPIEFLRYLLFKATTRTLLIKNKETIEAIKTADRRNLKIVALFKKYQTKYGLERLAEIFYRFKPLFLAFKVYHILRPIINKIRKLAKKHHKPFKDDFLNTITARIKRRENIDKSKLDAELSKVNIFRKIRLAQALNYRTIPNTNSILYKIRNGRSFATSFSFTEQKKAKEILQIVENSIVKSISANVKGKKIYLPSNVHYTLPSTEKQFTGNFPSGSSISVDKEMIFGVHWTNSGRSIDLDLSLINIEKGKIGWDAEHRSEDKTILFSGDLTDAPKPQGASELFYIKRQEETNYLIFLNYYNYEAQDPIPFKILVGREHIENFDEKYMVNPNNILCVADSFLNVRQKLLGLVILSIDGSRFYFNESNLGWGFSSEDSKFGEYARKYLHDYCVNQFRLIDYLEKAGAILLDTKEESEIDLSPEKIEKDTILNLLI